MGYSAEPLKPSSHHPATVFAEKLAAQPEIESIPWFGTSWYRRGPDYWWRRFLLSLVLLAVVAIYVAIIGAVLLTGLDTHSGRNASAALLVIVVVTSIATGIWMWRRPEGGSERVRGLTGAAAGGAALGTLARAGLVLGYVVMFLGAVLTLGPMLVLFIKSITNPHVYVERRARERLERWNLKNGRSPRPRT